jgi:hypothetical protein
MWLEHTFVLSQNFSVMSEKELMTKEHIERQLLALKKKRRRVDLSKYAGKVKFDIDPLTYQKQVRDEWR